MKIVIVQQKQQKRKTRKMSDDDKSVSEYSMSTDSQASDDSFSDIQEQLEGLTDIVGAFTQEIEALEKQLESLQRPVEGLELAQMGDIPFLSTSPFRHATFLVKPPGIPGINLETRYPFQTICEMLRNHLFESGLVKPDGTVTLNKQLKQLFETKKKEVTYLELLQMLRHVLI